MQRYGDEFIGNRCCSSSINGLTPIGEVRWNRKNSRTKAVLLSLIWKKGLRSLYHIWRTLQTFPARGVDRAAWKWSVISTHVAWSRDPSSPHRLTAIIR